MDLRDGEVVIVPGFLFSKQGSKLALARNHEALLG
jgi:hypothetical protein